MPKRSKANTAKKQAHVAELLKNDPKMSMNAAGKAVTSKFGTQLAYDKLREAFTAAGGKVAKRGRKKGRKTAAEGTARKPGRRKSDRAAVKLKTTLSSNPNHLVVVRSGKNLEPHPFDTVNQAREFATKCLANGSHPNDVSYFQRKSLEVTTSI